MPGANRERAGHQPAAGPAVPAGDRGQSGHQGEGAAGPVQHPHRCTGRQLMNSRHHLTHTHHSCLSTNELTGVRRCELPVSTSRCHMSGGVTIYELLVNKKFLVFLLFRPIHTRLGVLSPFVRATYNQTSYLKTLNS